MLGPALELKDVCYAYEPNASLALGHVSLTVNAGEWVAIVGASGSGKSTLAGLISGYLPRAGGGIRQGELRACGLDPAEADIAEVARHIGVVFQDPDAQLVQGRVEDEVAFGPENLCVPAAEIRRRVADALNAVDLASRRMDRVHALSGGVRQRTAIAAVLALTPSLLVLDEATASLDAASRRRLQALLRRLHGEGRTVLTLSGRIDELAGAAPRLVVLEAGTVLPDGPADELLRSERARLAQLGLLQAAPAAVAQAAAPQQYAPAEAQDSLAEAPPAALSSSPASTSSHLAAPPNASQAPLLTVRGLTYAYDRKAEPVLRNVELSLQPGEWRLLCGENGSGKTTLSRLIMGLIRPPKGTVFWRGQDISSLSLYRLASDIGYIFQQPEQQFVAHTVMDELLYGPRSEFRLRPADPLPEDLQLRACQMLEAIGLSEKTELSPYLLSGGEKRLLSVAAAMISPKQLYILDEPTAGIDYNGLRILIRLCSDAVAAGASLIVITHEPNLFAGTPAERWNMENISPGSIRANMGLNLYNV
ncbi:ABC transporter ATP-binding protein [Paenibacillus puldeungensis]|uniref:ABC transporter ATP-binding protein n=1 Tax=Paenibacillus puldeungensis TaxID=696536 RepID=A0ABW3RZ52_9BACL